MANPYQRCSRYWKKDNPPVQCERWDGHTWRHSAFDHDGLLLEWGGVEAPKRDGSYLLPGFDSDGLPLQGEEHVPWNQPVPDNLEVDKTVTAEDHRADDEQVLRIGRLEKLVEEWEGRVAGLIEANRRLMCERDDAIHARDVEARNAVGLLRKLEQVRALTNGVPNRADA